MGSAIKVSKLEKRYGEESAVNGISFKVQEGEIFGLLGPNGAGKTTTTALVLGLGTVSFQRMEVS